jgi:hypothetical protein
MSFKVKKLLLLLMVFPFADSECSEARKKEAFSISIFLFQSLFTGQKREYFPGNYFFY